MNHPQTGSLTTKKFVRGLSDIDRMGGFTLRSIKDVDAEITIYSEVGKAGSR